MPRDLTLALALGGCGLALALCGLWLALRSPASRVGAYLLGGALLLCSLASWLTVMLVHETADVYVRLQSQVGMTGTFGDRLARALPPSTDPELLLDYARARYFDRGVRIDLVGADGTTRDFEPTDEERRLREGRVAIFAALPAGLLTIAAVGAAFPALAGALIWLAVVLRAKARGAPRPAAARP